MQATVPLNKLPRSSPRFRHSGTNGRIEAIDTRIRARMVALGRSIRPLDDLEGKAGAGDGLGTLSLDRGKVALYQVSYSRSAREGIVPGMSRGPLRPRSARGSG